MSNQMVQTQYILRGGGCGSQKINSLKSGISKLDTQDLHNFFNKFNFYVEKICTKAVVAADYSESQEIMIALQWFIFQEENIYNLNKNAQSVVKSYDLILEGIRKLLKSCLIYIRTDSFKCLYILQITASLSKLIFSFHILKEERFMKCDIQQEFLDISDELSQHMEIEKNDLIQNQMELYLFLTKTSFEIAPNNSNEREEILKGCLSGIIGSIIQMKPNEELLESLFQGACHLYKQYVISNNRKQFEVYFQIDMLQWEIINYFKNEKFQNLDEIISQVEEIHDKIVKNSNVWKYHYLWVQMIGKILQYNPPLTKQKLSQLINSFNLGVKLEQIWKEYQRKGFLIQMNHSNDQAVIQLNYLQNSQLSEMDRAILESNFKEWEIFLLLKDFFINEQYQNIPFTFGSYLKTKLEIEGKELQQNETILAIHNIQRFLGFLISNKLLNLTKQNDENLEEVIKISRNFTKGKQYNESTTLKISLQQIKKIIQKLKDYFQNIQDIIKIMRLNQNHQKKNYEKNNFEKLNIFQRLIEILQLYVIQDQRNQSLNQNFIDDNDIIQEQSKSILEELKHVDFKEYKISFIDLPITPQNRSKIRRKAEKLIGIYQKEIQRLETDLIQNNLLQYFQNLVYNLYLFYESKCNELQEKCSYINLYLKEIMIIMYQIETVPKILSLKTIKQSFANMHLLKCLENLRYNNLRLKLKLIDSKRSFSFILEKAKPEELGRLSEVINLDEFLLNVVKDFPQRIMRENTNFTSLIHNELQNIEITREDFEHRLSKQKGILTYVMFQQCVNEKQIEQERKDLELIEKEFEEFFFKETPSELSMETIWKIVEDLKVEESLKTVMDDKFNFQELRLEKEKYFNFLSQLRKLEVITKDQPIGNWNLLITQTEAVIKTIETFGQTDEQIVKMLINEELMNLKTILNDHKITQKEQQISIIQEQIRQVANEKINDTEQIELNLQIERQSGNREIGSINQMSKKFKFCSYDNYRTNLTFLIKVVKLKKLKLQYEIELLYKLFAEVVILSEKLDQIQKFEIEIQTKFQERLQCYILEFIKKFELQQLTEDNLYQKEGEDFHFYLEGIETKLIKRVNDTGITQANINIPDFLNCLELYIKEQLVKQRCFSNIKIGQEFLIQQLKKIYLEGIEEEGDEESKQQFGLIDNQVQKSKDIINNDQWKIKQGLVFTIIQISSNCFSENITSFCSKVLIQVWVQEQDQRVRNILKNQNLIGLQMQVLQKDWSTQHDRIAGKMQEMLRRIDELQEQVSHEANLKKQDLYMKEIDDTTMQLDQQIENISEMGQQLRLITDFVNHIRKGLIRVEGKINEMKEQLKSMGNDIKLLRGKTVEQLFEIRKWKVLKDAAQKNTKNIYVPLQTLEIIQKQQKEETQPSSLMNLEDLNDRRGKVNEFLLEDKTVLLIHGQAGSGKSTTAKKIEEFIWKQHEKNEKIRNQLLIPVYISLPSLKNPVFQVVEETLHQDEYGFDKLQLKECKEMLEKKEFKFLLIMDSYDEMKLEHIQKNLYISNKLKQIWSDPLVIFTTRSEIFTSNNYTQWFEPEKKEEFKEVQLLKFNEEQMEKYLKKFTTQSIKMLLFEIYEWQTQISNRGAIDINKFEIFWEKFFLQFSKSEITNSENLLNEKQIERIELFLKNDEFIALKSTEALRSLSINLQKLWSVEKYEKMIKNINLNKLVETPYMMEIVVQVLPEMVKKATEIYNVKQNFFKNFPNMLKVFYKSKFLIEMYKQRQNLTQLNNEIEKQSQLESKNKNYEVIVKTVHNPLQKLLKSVLVCQFLMFILVNNQFNYIVLRYLFYIFLRKCYNQHQQHCQQKFYSIHSFCDVEIFDQCIFIQLSRLQSPKKYIRSEK